MDRKGKPAPAGTAHIARRPEKSYHAPHRVTDNDIFDNKLIFGDNLLALKALEQEFSGKIKCVFIDPPYNTGSAFSEYDDGVEHSLWLGLMRDRIEISGDFFRMMAPCGLPWTTTNTHTAEFFVMRFSAAQILSHPSRGTSAFLQRMMQNTSAPTTTTSWCSRRRRPPGDQIASHAAPSSLRHHKNPDSDPRGSWNSAAYTCAKSAAERPNLYYAIVNPNTGEKIWPNKTRVWAYDEARHRENERNGPFTGARTGRARCRESRSSWIRDGMLCREVSGTMRRRATIKRRNSKRWLCFRTNHFRRRSQNAYLAVFFSPRRSLASGSWTPSLVPAQPGQWLIKWAVAGSWWSWASIATRTSSHA